MRERIEPVGIPSVHGGEDVNLIISVSGTQTQPQVPDGDWYKHFGSFKICGRGSYPKTFLLPGQPAKGEAL
jgi:hypothetical protein